MNKLQIIKLTFLNVVMAAIVGYCMFLQIENYDITADVVSGIGLVGAMKYFHIETKWIFSHYKVEK